MSENTGAEVAHIGVYSAVGGRARQEDYCGFGVRDQLSFLALADGMGGHPDGDEAASVAVKTMLAVVERADAWEVKPEHVLREAHEALAALGEDGRRPRTTAVILIIRGDQASWAHVGDSRIYWFRRGKLMERTRDHSVVEVLLQEGEISERRMGSHSQQGRLLQSLGGDSPIRPAVGGTGGITGDDMFLLCSDGLWSAVSARYMGRTLSRYPARAAASRLVERALRRTRAKGDNISCALWQRPDRARELAQSRADSAIRNRRRGRWVAALLIAAVVSLLAGWLWPGWFSRANGGAAQQSPETKAVSARESMFESPVWLEQTGAASW